jgi:hypothetical protein
MNYTRMTKSRSPSRRLTTIAITLIRGPAHRELRYDDRGILSVAMQYHRLSGGRQFETVSVGGRDPMALNRRKTNTWKQALDWVQWDIVDSFCEPGGQSSTMDTPEVGSVARTRLANAIEIVLANASEILFDDDADSSWAEAKVHVDLCSDGDDLGLRMTKFEIVRAG